MIQTWDLEPKHNSPNDLDRWILDSPALGTVDHMTVGFSTVAPGTSSPRHAPPADELWYIVRGVGVAYIGDEEIPLKPYVGFLVKADVMQHCTNTGDEPLDVLWVYAPPEAIDHLVDPMPQIWPRE